MNRLRPFLFSLAALCLYSASAFANLEAVDECIPGGLLTAKVTGASADAFAVQLRDFSGKARSQNLLFSLPHSDNDVLYGLLGVPAFLARGTYTVAVTAEDGTVLESRPVTVREREYLEETIWLNQSMSELRLSDDERKLRETKELQDVLGRRDTGAVYHLGPFAVPLEAARITAHFGDQRVFIYADAGSENSVHSGVDLAAPTGTPVHSSGRGLVVLARERLLTGNTIVVEHLPGVFALYYHLDEIDVAEGDLVTENAVLGAVGSTGLATGPHLHWEFRVGGVQIDPYTMIDFTF